MSNLIHYTKKGEKEEEKYRSVRKLEEDGDGW